LAQTFFRTNNQDITPTTTGAWVDIDLSSYLPTDASMAIIHVWNSHATMGPSYGLRCKGSTDDRYRVIYGNRHTWAMVKVDENRKIQAKIENTVLKLYLVGYTTSNGVTGFTNGIAFAPSTGAWQDMDLSGYLPAGAKAAIFEVDGTAETYYGLRKKGSTDNRTHAGILKNQFTFIIGVNDNRVCQGYRSSTSLTFYLLGYVTDGVTMNTNATDISLSTTGSYVDIDLGDGIGFGFIEVVSPSVNAFALRRKGDSQDIYGYNYLHQMAVVPADADSIIQGKISSTAVDFYLVGTASAAPAYYERTVGFIIG